MKILVYEWGSYLQHDIYEILKEKGVDFSIFPWKFRDKNLDDNFEKWFWENVNFSQYDAILSINYWPLLSKVCQIKGKKYIAWCYDNPLNVERMEETLINPVNYVFLFDRVQYTGYKNMGINTVYHMPLGVNARRLSKITITGEEREKYTSDVSLVGSLYESRLYEIIAPLSEEIKEFIHTLIDVQLRIYGKYLFDEMITADIINEINRQYQVVCPETDFQINKAALTFAMASEVTKKERIILLNLCGKRYATRFYSYQSNDLLQNVKLCPPVDYVSEMPKVFACSKINMNPTLKITQTGIPLRVFDIMGAGGFLLSNYQEEILELYDDEKELVLYDSMEDAMAKIDFYLRHDELRQKILLSGRERTLRENSLQDRMERIFKIVFS